MGNSEIDLDIEPIDFGEYVSKIMEGNPVNCLVVDDEASVRTPIAKAVARAGYDCEQAEDVESALRLLGQAEFHVVLSDINMPGRSGLELLDEVQRRWPHTAVIMLTNVTEVDTAVTCLKRGAYDYLTKPFQINEIGARIGQAVERRRLVVENERYQKNLAQLVGEQAKRIEELYLEGIQVLIHALEAKDQYTKGHTARVGVYAAMIGETLGLTTSELAELELGAELHDAGKIGIKESVLLKPTRLTEEEYEHIKQHTTIGEHILKPLLNNAPPILQIVRWHHERLDGDGFPDGLSGDQIPKLVRIVTVADTFDAMTTGRPYRDGLPVEEAIDELKRYSGLQFDPEAVKAFLSASLSLGEFPIPTPPRVARLLPEALAAPPLPAPPG